MFKLGSNAGQNRLQRDKVCRVDIYVTDQIVNVSFFLSKSTKCGEGMTQDTAELFKQCIGDTSINR